MRTEERDKKKLQKTKKQKGLYDDNSNNNYSTYFIVFVCNLDYSHGLGRSGTYLDLGHTQANLKPDQFAAAPTMRCS